MAQGHKAALVHPEAQTQTYLKPTLAAWTQPIVKSGMFSMQSKLILNHQLLVLRSNPGDAIQ